MNTVSGKVYRVNFMIPGSNGHIFVPNRTVKYLGHKQSILIFESYEPIFPGQSKCHRKWLVAVDKSSVDFMIS